MATIKITFVNSTTLTFEDLPHGGITVLEYPDIDMNDLLFYVYYQLNIESLSNTRTIEVASVTLSHNLRTTTPVNLNGEVVTEIIHSLILNNHYTVTDLVNFVLAPNEDHSRKDLIAILGAEDEGCWMVVFNPLTGESYHRTKDMLGFKYHKSIRGVRPCVQLIAEFSTKPTHFCTYPNSDKFSDYSKGLNVLLRELDRVVLGHPGSRLTINQIDAHDLNTHELALKLLTGEPENFKMQKIGKVILSAIKQQEVFRDSLSHW